MKQVGDKLVCSHGRGEYKLDLQIILGTEDGKWPMTVFTEPEHAADWLANDPSRRHAYIVPFAPTAEVLHVPAVPASTRVVPFENLARFRSDTSWVTGTEIRGGSDVPPE